MLSEFTDNDCGCKESASGIRSWIPVCDTGRELTREGRDAKSAIEGIGGTGGIGERVASGERRLPVPLSFRSRGLGECKKGCSPRGSVAESVRVKFDAPLR